MKVLLLTALLVLVLFSSNSFSEDDVAKQDRCDESNRKGISIQSSQILEENCSKCDLANCFDCAKRETFAQPTEIEDITNIYQINSTSSKTKTKKKYEIAVCAVFANEGRYLKEWLEFHLLMGVQHFYLYAGESTPGDPWKAVLKPYEDEELVSFSRFKTSFDVALLWQSKCCLN
jgi:hypothetical protein